ncbi:MAG: TIGR01212 family radical SAM protein [Bacteroidetes bacterium GWA2_31_9]|nr:MAG: TIGR01212 family radical SAM protein [Bacteroidetes bacterium GWA2_31_9]
MEYSWEHKRRFNSYSEHFKQIFGERVQKLSVNAGFTCPNRDGKIATGGCIFCNNDAFNPSYCKTSKSISQQISEGIEFHKVRYRRASKYLAYFQAYSNTYDTIENLKLKYSEALNFPEVCGLIIGTRPDCVSDEVLDYLAFLSKKYYIMVEYGVESCYNKTLEFVNRGHTFEQAVDAIERTHKLNIKIGTHLIFGLPYESREMMLNEAKIMSDLPIDNIKFHQLQIFKNTELENIYNHKPEVFNLFSLDDYIDFIIQFTERLNPRIVIERFNSEVPPRFLASSNWGLLRLYEVMNLIEKEMEKRDTWQGRLFEI